ncbi:MAG: succinate-semialdehyde dehydrogenase / glutarate-semialdehyde dehydrogenase [Solirubrobacteraceae bacterium]|jgi:succinate-semialdehyde dehydrogenase/glutarate-semialdehyde dehydrogenase|nr:succinate-semialdehyde dehydrogenase / glutarate-semialdehyde dehydrogenase [Solirubrobacteraceae bacterium]
MGKLIGESAQEADISPEIVRYYGVEGPRIAAARPLVTDAGDAVLVNERIGTLLGIEPWNYPLYQVIRLAAPNLVLGNTILLKHASSARSRRWRASSSSATRVCPSVFTPSCSLRPTTSPT